MFYVPPEIVTTSDNKITNIEYSMPTETADDRTVYDCINI